MESIKINTLEIENVKKVRAVSLNVSENGLTIIGGDNGNGKTSILDAIEYALGGEKNRPSELKNVEEAGNPYIKLKLSNGLIVERKGKNTSLTVTDPEGVKHGQRLLDSFISEFALDIESFINASEPVKNKIILSALGDEKKLEEIETLLKKLESDRTLSGRKAADLQGYLNSIKYDPELPKEKINIDQLLLERNELIKKNDQINRLKGQKEGFLDLLKLKKNQIFMINEQISDLNRRLNDLDLECEKIQEDIDGLDLDISLSNVEPIGDLEKTIEEAQKTNEAILQNGKYSEVKDLLDKENSNYDSMTRKIAALRIEKKSVIEISRTKLNGLEWDGESILFNGVKWDGMSGSEKLIVSTSISRLINPQCGFVLIDKLEQMDLKTLETFGIWLKDQGLQAIGTRVSKGNECSIIIEDGSIMK